MIEVAARERASHRDAVLECCSARHQSVEQIADEVRDEWGACSNVDVRFALHELARNGLVELEREGWARPTCDPAWEGLL